jgi:uncharacterized metal-binding protein YceD (DUF177 family)
MTLVADEVQSAGLARRFGLLSLAKLEADVSYWQDGDVVRVQGNYVADLEQPCVATGKPVSEHIVDQFKLSFISETRYAADTDTELDESDCDTLFHNGRIIDIGEAVAQSLGLALNPFPRSDDADAVLQEAGVLGEHQAGPFAALAALRTKQD